MNGSFANDFQAVTRFAIERRIGAGGMGVVYRAFDHQRGQWVALKTLRYLGPADLYRFKREFRTLADLVHPNLVTLYELIAEGQQWFFTMEFIEGVHFLEYVRSNAGHCALPTLPARPPDPSLPVTLATSPCFAEDGATDATARHTNEPTAQGPGDTACPSSRAGRVTPSQLLRLRAALEQLVQGVLALHEAGYLHRDIKPGNVRVTPQGRVVVLDFGLATHFGGGEITAENLIVGTAPYMSPEQAAGKPVTPESDWYSVGVMLYEALAGRRPFQDSSLHVLAEKQHHDPPPLRETAPEAPEDLASLCAALLDRDPRKRPTGRQILDQLASHSAATLRFDRPMALPPPPTALFVGRHAALRQLDAALDDVRRGRPVTVIVEGRSGMGKTALVQQFLNRLGVRPEVVVLTGRCYERESVPYKAVDNVIDALSRYLARLSAEEANALLPRDVASLVRVFPVLEWVEALAQAPRREGMVQDQQELRQRAFAALREMLARLGDRKTLIVAIDDLQWGDLDSVTLLHDLLRPPDPPVFLLIACCRSEDTESSPVLRAMLDRSSPAGQALELRKVAVEPLDCEEARELALILSGRHDQHARRLSEMIARESQGSPYFVDTLVRYASHRQEGAEEVAASAPTLDEVLWAQASELPESARRLLEVIVVAAHPLRQSDALHAAELSPGAQDAVYALQVAHLVRTTGCGLEDSIETYHDRVREAVVARLSPETRSQRHLRLARTLESAGGADPAQVAAHFAGAGENESAGRFYAMAADEAANALAFDRAARQYRLALELSSARGDGERQLRRKLADALANAGYGKEAGDEYLRCASAADADEALELRRRAATQLLTSGHIDQGLAVLKSVLRAWGIPAPRTPRAAYIHLILARARLWWRGLDLLQRRVAPIRPRDANRLDLYWSATTGLSLVDPLRSAFFHARGLLAAMHVGDPLRAARFLAMEGILTAIAGESTRRRVDAVLARVEEIARELGDPYTTALLATARGVTSCLQGEWRRCVEECDRAEQLFRDRCVGVVWELDTAQGFAPSALSWAGEVRELARRFPHLYRDAEQRGSLFALARMCTFVLPYLAADDPDEAERRIAFCMKRWSHEGFHVQHYNALYGQVQIDLYRGDGASASRRIQQQWPALARSLLLRSQLARVFIRFARACSALATCAEQPGSSALFNFVASEQRRIEHERTRWAMPLACLVRANLAACRRDYDAACVALPSAIAGFDAADMPLYAAAARRVLGRLLGGDTGRALVARGDQWMASQGIRNPDRMTNLFCPGQVF
jgi:serine/threonine protein kinase